MIDVLNARNGSRTAQKHLQCNSQRTRPHQPFNLDLLKTFAAIVDCGGFTKAAERVHLTQSMVSQQVKKLEQSFDSVLLLRDKSSGTVETTEAGERLLSYAGRILATAEEASEAMLKPSAPRTLRLVVPEDFAGRRLIELLSGFSTSSPHIRLDTVSGWSTELIPLLMRSEPSTPTMATAKTLKSFIVREDIGPTHAIFLMTQQPGQRLRPG